MSINEKYFQQCLWHVVTFLVITETGASYQSSQYEHVPKKKKTSGNLIDAKSVCEYSYKGTTHCPVREACHSKIIPLLKLFKTLNHGLLSIVCRVLQKRHS